MTRNKKLYKNTNNIIFVDIYFPQNALLTNGCVYIIVYMQKKFIEVYPLFRVMEIHRIGEVTATP